MILVNRNWYVLQVRRRAEVLVAAILGARGYEVFLPCLNTSRSRGGKQDERPPLFPGYVFCRYSDEARENMVGVHGVVRIVSFNNRPEPVNEAELDSVRILCRSGALVRRWQFIREGQPIRITSGPLAGVEGVFVSVSSAEFVVVNITMLQRAVLVKVPGNSIVLARDVSVPRPRLTAR